MTQARPAALPEPLRRLRAPLHLDRAARAAGGRHRPRDGRQPPDADGGDRPPREELQLDGPPARALRGARPGRRHGGPLHARRAPRRGAGLQPVRREGRHGVDAAREHPRGDHAPDGARPRGRARASPPARRTSRPTRSGRRTRRSSRRRRAAIMPVSRVDGKPLGAGGPDPSRRASGPLYWEKREAGWRGTAGRRSGRARLGRNRRRLALVAGPSSRRRFRISRAFSAEASSRALLAAVLDDLDAALVAHHARSWSMSSGWPRATMKAPGSRRRRCGHGRPVEARARLGSPRSPTRPARPPLRRRPRR